MMVDYGGMGGIEGGRTVNADDKFEAAVEHWLGSAMREDESLCVEMWCAIANQDWRHDNGDTAGYSFRAAGDLVSAVVGRGDYMDWYCSGPDGVVSERVRSALAQGGWHPVTRGDVAAAFTFPEAVFLSAFQRSAIEDES